MNLSDALLWAAVVAPYCATNAIGLQYFSWKRRVWIKGMLYGIVEYVLILSLIVLALRAYWVGGELVIPFLILSLTVGKAFLLGVLRSMRPQEVLRSLLWLVVCMVASFAVFRWIGTPLALTLFPDAPRGEISITAAQFSYWVLTSYPYLLKWQQSGSNK